MNQIFLFISNYFNLFQHVILAVTSCPPGWSYSAPFPNLCYFIPTKNYNFQLALSYCQNTYNGASLPIFKSRVEYEAYNIMMYSNAL